jgi:hypothetical protein
MRYSRRQFLVQASALSAAATLPAALYAQTPATDPQIDLAEIEQRAASIPGKDTVLKFNADGSRRPFAGNTVICHLPVQSVMRDAMVALHEDLVSSPFRHKLGLTSTDSYHMTIFPGANDQGRSAYGWPSYVPLEATIEECNRLVGERMARAHLDCELPLRVRVDLPSTLNYFAACTLRMVPIDSAENTKLRSIRDKLSEVYSFRTKDHDQYGFHITMSYQTARFTKEEQISYRRLLKTHMQRIMDAAPVLELGNPEYCTFPDMFRFEPKTLIACS